MFIYCHITFQVIEYHTLSLTIKLGSWGHENGVQLGCWGRQNRILANSQNVLKLNFIIVLFLFLNIFPIPNTNQTHGKKNTKQLFHPPLGCHLQFLTKYCIIWTAFLDL